VDAVLTGPLEQRDIPIEIDLGEGEAEYLFLASDLGHDYISCNADYRS
jgi:glutamate N-acetyltransferase/amino-acid N-acetyltransferase